LELNVQEFFRIDSCRKAPILQFTSGFVSEHPYINLWENHGNSCLLGFILMSEPMTDRLLGEWLDAALEAARRGAEQLESWRAKFTVREKSRADLVTDADYAAQKAIFSFLQSAFPTHCFVGEEDTPGTVKGRVPANAPPTWIVDPLDGTSNYVHDVPAYCVSIGLMVAHELVVGVIFDPRQNEMFAAAKGAGATLNGKPMRVSAVPTLAEGLISTGFPPDPEAQERNLTMWQSFSYKAQALRRTGSTALNMAYVAAGRFDGYWAFDNHAWDVAGGVVLIQEAGGSVSRADGSKLDVFCPDILATNSHIHAEMLEALQLPR
jgi:myo-inositol-1(or 4)-monophosphatase